MRPVKIINRGSEESPKYTSQKRAARFINQGYATPVTIGDDGLLVEISMVPYSEALSWMSSDRTLSLSKHNVHAESLEVRCDASHTKLVTRPNSLPPAGPSLEYIHWRESVLIRDGYKCVWCGSTENLEADHIKPKSVFPDLMYEVGNGRTLCNPCHRKTDTYGRKGSGISSIDNR